MTPWGGIERTGVEGPRLECCHSSDQRKVVGVLPDAIDDPGTLLVIDLNPAELARTLTAVIQGGYVFARTRASQGPMDAAIREAVSLLDADQSATSTHQ